MVSFFFLEKLTEISNKVYNVKTFNLLIMRAKEKRCSLLRTKEKTFIKKREIK